MVYRKSSTRRNPYDAYSSAREVEQRQGWDIFKDAWDILQYIKEENAGASFGEVSREWFSRADMYLDDTVGKTSRLSRGDKTGHEALRRALKKAISEALYDSTNWTQARRELLGRRSKKPSWKESSLVVRANNSGKRVKISRGARRKNPRSSYAPGPWYLLYAPRGRDYRPLKQALKNGWEWVDRDEIEKAVRGSRSWYEAKGRLAKYLNREAKQYKSYAAAKREFNKMNKSMTMKAGSSLSLAVEGEALSLLV